jgi:hypothetical protein
MSKLKAEKGVVYGVSEYTAENLQVRFKRAAISSSGDVGEVHIWQTGAAVTLTYAQAVSLANQIMSRCQ